MASHESSQLWPQYLIKLGQLTLCHPHPMVASDLLKESLISL